MTQVIRRKPQQQNDVNPKVQSHYGTITERVLRHRGVFEKNANHDDALERLSTQAKYLKHYKSLKDVNRAAILLAESIKQQKQICIVGDFDADGATSTALCLLAFRAMAYYKVDYIVPNRFDYGYGLTKPVVDMAIEQGAQVIITVDNGISSIEAVAYAKQNDLSVIITDHHLPAEELPIADAIVNPNQPGCDFESKNLAGVGVAFYLMSALKNVLEQQDYFTKLGWPVPNMAQFLDIVAVGTVADVVPLDGNNRILVHQGIQRIRSGKTRPGILALLNVTSRNHRRCSTSDIGFAIGPRLNAAGRLEDMSRGIECLICDDANTAAQYAVELDGLNQSRREIEQSMRDDAERIFASTDIDTNADTGQIPSALIVYQADFHQGVVGIVAGRLKEKYYRPCIVFANEDDNFIKGSARSIDGVHIRDALVRVDSLAPGLIKKFGGHAMAAGLSIAKNDLAEFETVFMRVIADAIAELTDGKPLVAAIYSDGDLSHDEMTLENASLLKYSLPWGQAFEEPIFDSEFELIQQRIVGQSHLKMVVKKQDQVFDAIAFNVDTKVWPNDHVRAIKLAYKLDINEFRGQTNVQLLVSHIEALR